MTIMPNEIQFILYNLPEEEGRVQVVIKDETIWCTQKAMSRLFGVDKSGISRHISNIFKDGELQQDATVAKIATVVNRGIRGEVEESVDFYNLDMIISVGYRVRYRLPVSVSGRPRCSTSISAKDLLLMMTG